MLLILTDEFDKHADVVIEKLKQSNVKYYRFDLNVRMMNQTTATFSNNKWEIKQLDSSFSSDAIDCVWCRRPFIELMLEERYDESIDFRIWKNEWNKTLSGLYNSLKDRNWLNPLRKAYKGENKYYQMEIANKIGLTMPPIIISNDKAKLIQFASEHNNDIVFKLMFQDIYKTDEGVFKGLYVNRIKTPDIEKMFEDQSDNPIVLQQYIEKSFEVRYTVVGDKHFACKIESQRSEISKEDWRKYDIPNTPHYKIDPPNYIKEKVQQLIQELDLEFGTIDFIVTPNNEWIFLEINCMGQWLWIETLTGLNISDAIVEWIKSHVD